MAARFDDGFSDPTRQFAALADRANRLALENAESAFGVQLRTFERNANATAGFLGELTQPGPQADLPSLLPKGLQVAQENLQRLASAGQEIAGLGLKTGQALAELARQPFESGSGRRARAKAR
ncbi:phasin family protein [Stenotrophomonas sp. MYb238]|uniref:phasin family protein n=1 Tax=Stenotrophomonas sp. MYb238 TaxID=2040281 RepID=UPI00129226FC|nr:phasin family protein [Stenotrophomonas sp. MYb238]MQP77614.1 phasin family protein [Stenotrophomonas sp. MYb238]